MILGDVTLYSVKKNLQEFCYITAEVYNFSQVTTIIICKKFLVIKIPIALS
jgi:hypothetical protein